MWAKLGKALWQWRGVLITAPTVAGVLMGLRLTGVLQSLELAALDQFFLLRPAEAIDPRIAIVGITEADVQKLGKWPMSDAVLTKLLKTIKQQQPKAIGLDLYRDLPVQPGYSDLVKVFNSTPNLIGIQKVVGDGTGFAVNPPPVLSKLGQVSANDLIVDTDGKVRRALLSVKDQQGQTIGGLGAAIALTYLDTQGIKPEMLDADNHRLKLGKAIFEPFQKDDGGYVQTDAGGYQILSNFRNLREGFATISMTDVLEGRMPAEFARDRIVLIGVTAASLGDTLLTPYSSGLGNRSLKAVSGVTIHADVASQLVSAAIDGRNQLRVWSDPVEFGWVAVWSIVGATISWALRHQGSTVKQASRRLTQKLPLNLVSIVLLGSGLVGGSFLAFLQGWWIPVVPPLLGMVGSAVVVTGYVASTAAGMRQTFGRYLTDEVVASLLESPEGLKLGGERRKVTIMMSDLRGFSAISERVSPETAVAFINLYLESMTQVINEYKGTINEIMGDGIFVMFGAPVQREDDVQRSIACAIAMQLALESVNQKIIEMNLPALEMGIGINTGEVLAGNIGSHRRAKYTVVGSHVNLTARIESYSVGGQILISKDTLKEVAPIVRVDGQMQVQMKGIQDPISLYEIGGIGGEFNLFLPKEEAVTLIPLRQTIPLQYRIVEGKHLSETFYQATIVKLSTHTAVVYSKHSVEVLKNLQINLLAGSSKARGLGDVYAKVVEVPADNSHHFCIRFTAMPPEVAALLYYLRQEGDEG
ncbi:CHASE2 domain-containing protein [Phormidesmis sp. 146-33]